MRKPQTILAGVVFILGLIFILHAQEMATPAPSPSSDSIVCIAAESQGLSLVSPEDLPAYGTFWNVTTNGVMAPWPCPPPDTSLSIYAITTNGQYLVDSTGGQVAMAGEASVADALSALADAVVSLIQQVENPPLSRELVSPSGFSPLFESFDTNSALYLQITNVADGLAYLNLMNGTDYVYEIYSKTDLTATNWDIAGEVFPTDTNCQSFTVPALDGTNLFIWARDWTGITSNGNTTPDWWFYYWFGTTGLSDTDLDINGNTLLSDYQSGRDPNTISFTVRLGSQNFNSSPATGTSWSSEDCQAMKRCWLMTRI
jgi:hypothetical protein